MQNVVSFLNYLVCLLFVLCYSYQLFYIAVSLFKKPVRYPKAEKLGRYAVMICGRNEEAVIGNLIDSIKNQHYPAELVDVYVCADNCTDNTAIVARDAGAIVFERFNKEKIGKGYALNFLFKRVFETSGMDHYDGYFVFDADNLLDKRYIREMNKALNTGLVAVTSYRNSKNYESNWISAGYALWFLREARYLSNARMILGGSCAVSGTGFLISKKIIQENNGWHYYLLTEDIEFSIDTILKGYKIGYCSTAVFYDEQPEKFSVSWNQRIRWVKGYMQVFKNYGKRIVQGIFGTNGFSCYDMAMNLMPAFYLSMASTVINFLSFIISVIAAQGQIIGVLLSLLQLVSTTYSLMFLVGAITTFTEWKNIKCKGWKKILYMFTFPLFIFTFIPVTIWAITFGKADWKPIKHGVQKSIQDMDKKH